MSIMPAARVGDDIAHTNAGLGMALGIAAGVVVGAALIGATVATGGLALVAAVGGAAALTSAGGLGGMYIGEASMGPPCGKFTVGSPNVFVNGRPATMTFASFAACSKDPGPIPLATGSSTVFINIGMAGREGEKLGCSALSVKQTSPNVFIGGASGQDPRVQVHPEVPGWAVTALQVLGVAGAVLALPFAIATVGVAATIGGAVLGYVGGELGAKGGRALGEALGMSEAGIRALELTGGFLGGAVGGAAGVRGTQVAGNRIAAWRSARANPFANEPPIPPGATAKPTNFNASRPGGVDMNNLSPADAAAARTMRSGGYNAAKQEEVLNSGRDFSTQPGRQGDQMYGFSSKGYAKGSDSPYWMDEPTYRDMQARHYDSSTGNWNSAGVKNELALPCYNQANAVYQGTLQQDGPLVRSTINPATETVTYMDPSGAPLQTFTRSMSGGGTQITPPLNGVGGIRELP
jgi:uncharacterized Zn-binding protein involved in type VI secretion